MKSINITGKRNIDKINKVERPERKDTQSWNFDESFYTYTKQIEIVNNMYLDNSQEHEIILKREIEKKIRGYRNQDMQKKLIDLNTKLS